MPIVPGRGLAPGDGSALLLPGEDGEGEPDVGHDKVHDVVGEAADEVAPADRIVNESVDSYYESTHESVVSSQ